MTRRASRDVEKGCSGKRTAAKLRRLVDALDRGERFTIQVAGERIRVPPHAVFKVEHGRTVEEEELEF